MLAHRLRSFYKIILFYLLPSSLFAATNITNCNELMDINNNLGGDYVLANSINCSGKDFIPIGTVDKPFTGYFNGAGNTIVNLSIANGHRAAGLFGYTRSAEIKNLILDKVNIKITDATEALATLVGVAEWTKIQAVTVNGIINGNQNSRYVGGLVGLLRNDSSIYQSSTAVDIVASNPSGYVGGLVGQQIISDIGGSFTTGSVTGYSNVGGLTGNLKGGSIGRSYATGTVTSQYPNAYGIGGLVGSVDPSPNSKTLGAEISQTYATGNVNGNLASATRVGGLIGWISTGYGPTIENNFATGNVAANNSVGGLVGYNGAYPIIIKNTYAVGMVTAATNAGGLVGINVVNPNSYYVLNSYWDIEKTKQAASDGGIGKSSAEMYRQITYNLWDFDNIWRIEEGIDYPQFKRALIYVYDIKNCLDLQNINKYPTRSYILTNDIDCAGLRFQPIGGNDFAFTGTFNGNGYTIANLSINAPDRQYIGLFGKTDGATLVNIHLKNVEIIGYVNVGALVGQSLATQISTISASGHVVGTSYVGGLIGVMTKSQISNSMSSITVDASDSYAGGLVGKFPELNGELILNSYANGEVRGKYYVGGLVGSIYSSQTLKISNAYSSSRLSATCDKKETGCIIGGLVGSNGVKTLNSYYDNQMSGFTNSTVGEGRTTAQLYQKNTFYNWDFENIWGIKDQTNYPYLRLLSSA